MAGERSAKSLLESESFCVQVAAGGTVDRDAAWSSADTHEGLMGVNHRGRGAEVQEHEQYKVCVEQNKAAA